MENKLYTKEELSWLRNYLAEYADAPEKKPHRKHISNFHKNWKPVNEFLTEKFHPVIGSNFEFCFVMGVCGTKHDNVIHTDMCLRHSTLPQGMILPNDTQEKVYYTFLVCEDYDREVSDHKPCTYVFENAVKGTGIAPDIFTIEDIDLSLPTHEVSNEIREDLEQLPIEIISRLKILDRIDQEPLGIYYWQSFQYHVQNAFINKGVKWKNFFNIMACKKI
jgi:hypothetical protein